jgi:retinol dehydrogenase-12
MNDLRGRTILITGANTGIGRTTALALGKRGARLYLTARTEEKVRPVIEEIAAAGNDEAFPLALELSDLASVRACAQKFLQTGDPLHVLINNAGLAGPGGLTKDGFELTFGVNHLAHFLLTELLLDRLKASAPSRVVIVASKAHQRVSGIDFTKLREPTAHKTGFPEYGVSKLANVLHARELAKRLEGTGVTTYALHPGVIATDVWRKVPWPLRQAAKIFMKTAEEGAATTLYCATSEEVASHSGRYYDDAKERTPAPRGADDALAQELYERSVEWVRAQAPQPQPVP